MKFKFVDEFDVEETSTNKNYRHNKHANVNNVELTPEQRDKIANKLAKTRVNHKTILGYETEGKGITYAKYNKETEDFVVYTIGENNQPVIVSLTKKTIREFNIDKRINYLGEIPE